MNADDKSKKKKDASSMLQQPLLLFKEVKGFKVVARNISSLVAVKTSKDGVQFKEGGSVVVIPVDYPGKVSFMHIESNILTFLYIYKPLSSNFDKVLQRV
jgi:hypothetical protein